MPSTHGLPNGAINMKPKGERTQKPETQDQRLRRRLAEWQPRFRLDQWWIYHQSTQPTDGNNAEAIVDLENLVALIRIDKRTEPENEEYEVVHELLEILLTPLDVFARHLIKMVHDPDVREVLRNQLEEIRHPIIASLIWALIKKPPRPYPIKG